MIARKYLLCIYVVILLSCTYPNTYYWDLQVVNSTDSDVSVMVGNGVDTIASYSDQFVIERQDSTDLMCTKSWKTVIKDSARFIFFDKKFMGENLTSRLQHVISVKRYSRDGLDSLNWIVEYP